MPGHRQGKGVVMILPKRETEVVIAWLQAEVARAEQLAPWTDGGQIAGLCREAIQILEMLQACDKWETGAEVFRKMVKPNETL